MDFQALTDIFQFEIKMEQSQLDIRMRLPFDPAAVPVGGPALQRQNAMSYCEFREMKHMVDAVLRKPRTAALLHAMMKGPTVESARGIRKFLTENVAWRWWWGEKLSEAQADVVAIMLFRQMGLPHDFIRQLIMCEKWMIAYFRGTSELDTPLYYLLTYGSADQMLPPFLEDARLASEMHDKEADHHLACRIQKALPLIQCRMRTWHRGEELTTQRVAYFLNEELADVERVCDWLGLEIAIAHP
jgi:hypothetical protein